MPPAPPIDQFPAFPASWYLFGRSARLGSKPVAGQWLDQRLVGYRTAAGRPVVLEGRCAHLGADLGQGEVVGDVLRCPFHNWEYGPDGRCRHIPASDCVPSFARLRAYPTVERHGLVFFFNGPEPLFPLPFFEGQDPDALLPARPFTTVLNCPWFMVNANGFDVQHFRGAHDRQLLGEVQIDCPVPFARRLQGEFAVRGSSLYDRITRRFGGDRVRLTVTDWGGTIALAVAAFPHATSYGMVLTQPLGPDRCRVQVVVFVRRTGRHGARRFFDSLNVRLRRALIRRFLRSDAVLGGLGLTYNPHGLTASDRDLADYFTWLAGLPWRAARRQPAGSDPEAESGDGYRRADAAPLIRTSPSPGLSPVAAPPAERFPDYPVSWFLFGRSSELRPGPVSKEILGQRLVAYRTPAGEAVVLEGRCPHLGADLGHGVLDGEVLRCPFHGWEYRPDGRCLRTPGGDEVPSFARLRSYPTVERHGLVFFFNGPQALFPLPFFAGADPADFVASRPFGIVLNCPWYMVQASAFDAQHFRGVHERQMVGAPVVECPGPYCRRARARYRVGGATWRDRVTAWLGGDTVELSGDDWGGTLVFVTATFRRTRSHGLITTLPLPGGRALVRGIVFVRRSRTLLGRLLLDPLHGEIRRYFISQFLKADAQLALQGYRYNPGSFLAADEELAAYYRWLAVVSHGRPASEYEETRQPVREDGSLVLPVGGLAARV